MAEEEIKRKVKNTALIGVVGLIVTIIGLYLMFDWYFNTYLDSLELSMTESLRNVILALVLGVLMLVYAILILQNVRKEIEEESVKLLR